MQSHTNVLLGHGSGGRLSHNLIRDIFIKAFYNPTLARQTDAALLPVPSGQIAFTTDAFVVNPVFFPGGDIGKLAVAGTVNDLAVAGAKPAYLSASFIIEEGLPIEWLEKITQSMALEAKKAGVLIVTGDTKVVEKGKCDKIFITTTGIGTFDQGYYPIDESLITPGDKIIINGSIGDHGMAVMSARNDLNLHVPVVSDCASLNHLVKLVLGQSGDIRFMRDATRGGLGTVLTELCENKDFGILLHEDAVPVKESVRGICELLGFDPLYVANEGKIVMVVKASDADKIVSQLRQQPEGAEAAVIGEIVSKHPGKAWMKTAYGSSRVIDMLSGEQLPRIC